MTRKTYIKKLRALCVAIQEHPSTTIDYSSGPAMKNVVKRAKSVPASFGSYSAAWNCEAMLWARRFYMGENI